MDIESSLDKLTLLVNTVIDQCENNIKTMKPILNIIAEIKNNVKNEKVQQMPDEEQILNNEEILKKIDNSIQSSDTIIARRIELHKELGSFIEPTHIEKPTSVEPDNLPIITPLSKLNNKEKDILLKSIFNQAKFNVENILAVSAKDEDFDNQVSDEASRLLNIWIESNRKH